MIFWIRSQKERKEDERCGKGVEEGDRRRIIPVVIIFRSPTSKEPPFVQRRDPHSAVRVSAQCDAFPLT